MVVDSRSGYKNETFLSDSIVSLVILLFLWSREVIMAVAVYRLLGFLILGNAAVDLGLHDTYYVVAHFHFVLSLGAVIAIFSGVIFNGEKILGSKNLLPSSSSLHSLYHLVSTLIGILLTFSPMHFLGFNVMPRARMPRKAGCLKNSNASKTQVFRKFELLEKSNTSGFF